MAGEGHGGAFGRGLPTSLNQKPSERADRFGQPHTVPKLPASIRFYRL